MKGKEFEIDVGMDFPPYAGEISNRARIELEKRGMETIKESGLGRYLV